MIYADGVQDFSIAYRVDDPTREGFKRRVCGACVEEQEAQDPGKVAGHYKCEKCGQNYGGAEAYERAEKLLALICPVTARKRQSSERAAA